MYCLYMMSTIIIKAEKFKVYTSKLVKSLKYLIREGYEPAIVLSMFLLSFISVQVLFGLFIYVLTLVIQLSIGEG